MQCIVEDPQGGLWVGTWMAGFCRFIPEKDTFIKYTNNPSDKYSIPSNIVEEMLRLDQNLILIGPSQANMCLFNIRENKFYTSETYPEYKELLDIPGPYYCFTRRNNNQIWIGTFNGLVVFDLSKKKIIYDSRLKSEKTDNVYKTRGKDQAKYILVDNNNIVWVTYGGLGIDKYDPYQDKFGEYRINLNSAPQYQDYIREALFINKNNIWFTCLKDGLIQTDFSGKIKKRFFGDQGKHQISTVFSVTRDLVGNLWIGTNQGFQKIDPKNGQILKAFRNEEGKPPILNHNFVLKIVPDDNGSFWIVNQEGLNNFDPVTGQFIENDISRKFKKNKVNNIYKDRDGDYWLPTDNGLHFYNATDKNFKFYVSNQDNPNSIISNQVSSITEDTRNNIWFATKSGISVYNKRKDKFINIHENNILPENYSSKIESDNEGNIWVQSVRNINKIIVNHKDLLSSIVITYDNENGIDPKMHDIKKLGNGRFILLSEKSFYYFNPSEIEDIEDSPPIYFTHLAIAGKTIPAGSPELKGTSIIETNGIDLNYNQRIIRISFSALDYSSPKKNMFAYQLIGIDSSWVDLGQRKEISLMNLDPGNYTLRVKISNTIQTNTRYSKDLSIHVRPPWYKTWWAFLTYFIFLLGIIIIYRFIAIKAEKEKNRNQIEKLNAQKERELDQLKLKFFINVSHEFRTPLTLIISPLSKALNNTLSETTREYIDTAIKNAVRLKRLINELLDLRKLDSGKIKPELKTGRLELFIRNILSSFETLAVENQVKFNTTFNLNN